MSCRRFLERAQGVWKGDCRYIGGVARCVRRCLIGRYDTDISVQHHQVVKSRVQQVDGGIVDIYMYMYIYTTQRRSVPTSFLRKK